MPRQNFDVTLQGTQQQIDLWSKPDGSKVDTRLVQSKRASEFSTGKSRRKPTGWIPPTSYTFERLRRDCAVGYADVLWTDLVPPIAPSRPYYRNVGVVGNGAYGFDQAYYENQTQPFGSFYPSLVDQALIKARLKMKDGSVNLGVAFAERNATARLLGDTATTISKAVRQLRRGNVKDAARALGVGSRRQTGNSTIERWLELQYGWKPLLQDVYGSCDALSKRVGDHWRVTAKATVKVDVDVEKTYDVFPYPVRVRATGLDSCMVRIDAMPSNDLVISLSQLGILNPALVAWELVPFSFVLDWMLPIGDYLDSLDAMIGYENIHCSVSEWKKYRYVTSPYTGSYSKELSPGNLYTSKAVFSGLCERISLRRAAVGGVPMPTLPRFKDPRSLGHMANGLSLLAAAFGRR